MSWSLLLTALLFPLIMAFADKFLDKNKNELIPTTSQVGNFFKRIWTVVIGFLYGIVPYIIYKILGREAFASLYNVLIFTICCIFYYILGISILFIVTINSLVKFIRAHFKCTKEIAIEVDGFKNKIKQLENKVSELETK